MPWEAQDQGRGRNYMEAWKPLLLHRNLYTAFKACNSCPYLVASLAPQIMKEAEGGASLLSMLRRPAALPGFPGSKLGNWGSFCYSIQRDVELSENWHHAVTCLVSAFRILSFHSPSEYVNEGSLYITNHGLNFKAFDKNDLILHL